jgi:hypothetical protein
VGLDGKKEKDDVGQMLKTLLHRRLRWGCLRFIRELSDVEL